MGMLSSVCVCLGYIATIDTRCAVQNCTQAAATFDEDQPLPSSEPALQKLLKSLQEEPGLRVELIGHTDNRGSIDYNLDLSKRRAEAVQSWLIQPGIDAGRLSTDWRGLGEPITGNVTEARRGRNRRVEARALN